MLFGERIKKLRKQVDFTQSDLADATGVHIQTVSKWERDLIKPDFSMLGVLSNVFKTTLEDLLGVESENCVFGAFDVLKMGECIATLRKKYALSQSELAKKIDVSSDTVSKWERGIICPDTDRLLELSAIFNVAPSVIYYGKADSVAAFEKEKFDSVAVENSRAENAPSVTGKRKQKWNFFAFVAVLCALVIQLSIILPLVFNVQKTVNLQNTGENSSEITQDGNNKENGSSQPSNAQGNDSSQSSNGQVDEKQPLLQEPPVTFSLPVENNTIVQSFVSGKLIYNKTLNSWEVHQATDFSAAAGSKVFAIYGGKVICRNSDNYLWGGAVIIENDDGYEITYYGVIPNPNITVGSVVAQGDEIGKVAKEVNHELHFGEHVHIQAVKDEEKIDVEKYLI